MKQFTLIVLAFFSLLASARGEVRLFGWQESSDEKTGEPLAGFFIAPVAVMKAMEADARGDARPAQALQGKPPEQVWNYGIVLKGTAATYPKERLALFEPSPCGSILQVVGGSVDVDRKAGTVRVALKVTQDGKVGDFRGNGTYAIGKQPQSASAR